MSTLREQALEDLDRMIASDTLARRQVRATIWVGDQLVAIRQLLTIALFVLGLIAGSLIGGH